MWNEPGGWGYASPRDATGTMRKTGWRTTLTPAGPAPPCRATSPATCSACSPPPTVWPGVSLERRHAMDVITIYGRHRQVLLYIDPPYPGGLVRLR